MFVADKVLLLLVISLTAHKPTGVSRSFCYTFHVLYYHLYIVTQWLVRLEVAELPGYCM